MRTRPLQAHSFHSLASSPAGGAESCQLTAGTDLPGYHSLSLPPQGEVPSNARRKGEETFHCIPPFRFRQKPASRETGRRVRCLSFYLYLFRMMVFMRRE